MIYDTAHGLKIGQPKFEYDARQLIMYNTFMCKFVVLLIVGIFKCLTFKYPLKPHYLKLLMHCPRVFFKLSLYLRSACTSAAALFFPLLSK